MKNFILLFVFLLISAGLTAQNAEPAKKTTSTDSLFNAINGENKSEHTVIFESSRLILSQSTETIKKNNFNFLVLHRFGDFAGDLGGGKTFFGLDAVADVYIGFEY